MSLSRSDSIVDYVTDYDCLIEGVEFMFTLEQEILKQKNMEAIRRHYEKHPEDKLCHIYRPGTREMVSCRRSGIDAIWRMAARLTSEAANGHDQQYPL